MEDRVESPPGRGSLHNPSAFDRASSTGPVHTDRARLTCDDTPHPQIPPTATTTPYLSMDRSSVNSIRPTRCGRAPPRGRMSDPCNLAPAPGPNHEGHPVKFRVERDVLADAVAWAARSLPVRPSAPVLAGPADRGRSRRPGALHLRLRDVGARDPVGRGRRRGQGPGQRPAAGRHLPQPARQAGRHGARRRPGVAHLRLGAVQPADDAGRGLPDPPADADRDRHRAQRRRSPTPWPRRSRPPAATTCCRC